MRSRIRSLGLTFDVAPPPAAHPNRTDIALFVGTIARRTLAEPPHTMPAVIAHWLAALGFERIGGVDVDALPIELDSYEGFVAGMVERASAAERATVASALAFDALDSAARAQSVAELRNLVAACRTLSPLSIALLDDLDARGFVPGRLLGGDALAGWLRIQRLLNLPVAVESLDEFASLYDGTSRAISGRPMPEGDPTVATPLGAAVRAFFNEGGCRCWIVRTGDPSPVFATPRERFGACFPEPAMRAGDADSASAFDLDTDRCAQFPGVRRIVRSGLLADVVVDDAPLTPDPAAWQGLEHVYGLQEVSFACVPDVIDACAQPVPPLTPAPIVVVPGEAFHDCVREADPQTAPIGRRVPAPTLDAAGLEAWRKLVMRVLGLLANGGRAFHRRDVQLLASLPLPGAGPDTPTDRGWLQWMVDRGWLVSDDDAGSALMGDRLQLAYPWLLTRDSGDCQGGVEAPEGTLAGILARGALEQGAFHSIAGRATARYIDSHRALDWTQLTRHDVLTPVGFMTLAERVCLFGPSARGPALLSDVTCAAEANVRQGAVRRLVNVVVQVARTVGDEFAFEASGEELWGRVRESLGDLGRTLIGAGALSTDGVPFVVRCGPETMTQADLDAGRLVAEIELLPAQPVDRVVVVLAMRAMSAAVELEAA